MLLFGLCDQTQSNVFYLAVVVSFNVYNNCQFKSDWIRMQVLMKYEMG
jgi:hypothetical protein